MEFLNALPIGQLINFAADAVMELQTRSVNKVILSEEQFNTFFRIRGYRESGERENRGRSRKEPELDLNAE